MKEKTVIPINQEEISVYLKDIRKLPVMTPERQKELAKRMLSGELSKVEKEEIKFNTKVSMITPILDMDNDVSIAIKNIKDESTKEGVQLIAQKLEKFLKTQGIESIQTENYDEDLHEVISVVPTGESKVLDVISKGYMLNGKPFRHPKIVLSK